MCTHNVSGHGIGCQAVNTPYIYYIFSDKHTSVREEIKFHHLTYLKEAHFSRQLLIMCQKNVFFSHKYGLENRELKL